MARKTNKTAHVLNLITNPATDSEDDVNEDVNLNENPEVPSPVTNIKEPTSTPSPVVEILYNEHDPLSDLIKNVLEENTIEPIQPQETVNKEDLTAPEDAEVFNYDLEFDDNGNEIIETSFSEDTTVETENIETENSDVEIESSKVEEVENISVSANIKMSDELQVHEEVHECVDGIDCKCSKNLLSELERSENLNFHDRQDLNNMVDLDFKYVNVYEKIVQNKLLSYMKKFDMCMCDRCIVDTFALAVTELPTKIVVVDKKEVFPLINFFEVKNTAIISTAIIKACMIVKEKPKHCMD